VSVVGGCLCCVVWFVLREITSNVLRLFAEQREAENA